MAGSLPHANAAPGATTPVRQQLRAILAADAVGYSRLMSVDDRATIALLDRARNVFRREVAGAGGRVVDTAGDSVLAAFDSVGAALRSALSVQSQLDAALPFRIGLHLGDVIEQPDGSVYGDGVNIAARLQALAEPGGVLVSQAIHAIVAARQLCAFDDFGEHRLKNVAQPLRVWKVRVDDTQALVRRFGRYELRAKENRLLADGEPVAIGTRAFDLLLAMTARPGALLTKAELCAAVWPGLAAEDTNLAALVAGLRKLLGSELIVTVPGRGYRFDAQIDVPLACSVPPAIDVEVEATPPASAAVPAPLPRTNLPERLPPLFGRADDLAALEVLVAEHPLVTVVGSGGMGKTRLAQALLHARRDDLATWTHGVCWVELATVGDADALPGAVAAALGVSPAAGDALAGLCAAARPLTTLVALDNAEHLLDGVARLAQALLDAAPGLRLVVTSQAPLRLPAERVYRLESLAVPQGPLPRSQAMGFGAVALFVERAQAADARFALTDDNTPAVIELCRALDGLALAIELAAARAPMLGVQRLASSMQDRLRLLSSSRNRAAPARHQTLRAALEWSHGFLAERERAVFRRLSVFAGSGSLALIQQVVADAPGEGALDEWEVLDALGVLVDRSLVAIVATDEAEPRYRLLDTPRLFASELLRTAGEEDALRRRHARAIADHFEAAHTRRFDGSIGVMALFAELEADFDNARDAIAWARDAGDGLSVLRIAPMFLRSLMSVSAQAQARGLVTLVESLITPEVPPDVQVRAWLACNAALGESRIAHSRELVAHALEAVQRMPPDGTQRTLHYLARCAEITITSADRAWRSATDAALAALPALEDPAWPPHLLVYGARARLHARPAGSPGYLEGLRELRAMEEAAGAALITLLANMVDAELAAGHAIEAARMGTQFLEQGARTRQEDIVVGIRGNTMAALLACDDCAQARQVGMPGWAAAPKFDERLFFADSMALLAAIEGRVTAAARLIGYADAVWARLGTDRQCNEAASCGRATAIARGALGDAAFERLREEGRSLRDEQVTALAFATDDA